MTAADRARGLVADWTLVLVQGLPDAVARDRFDEIVSDLWEQQHDLAAHGGRPLRIATSILRRAARGVPADLAWRWAARQPRALVAPAMPRFDHPEGQDGMTRHPDPAAKPWVHLADPERPFDQTNGVVDFDVDDKYDPSDPELKLLERGAATSMMNMGGFSLGG